MVFSLFLQENITWILITVALSTHEKKKFSWRNKKNIYLKDPMCYFIHNYDNRVLYKFTSQKHAYIILTPLNPTFI